MTSNNNSRKSYNRFKDICYVCLQNKADRTIKIILKNGDSTVISICSNCREVVDKNHIMETADLKEKVNE
jgi:protein-arginine kinase activator protein McsA